MDLSACHQEVAREELHGPGDHRQSKGNPAEIFLFNILLLDLFVGVRLFKKHRSYHCKNITTNLSQRNPVCLTLVTL